MDKLAEIKAEFAGMDFCMVGRMDEPVDSEVDMLPKVGLLFRAVEELGKRLVAVEETAQMTTLEWEEIEAIFPLSPDVLELLPDG